MKNVTLGLVACLLSTATAFANPITLTDAKALDWQTTPEGVAFAALQGDRFTESYQAMVRLPAGTTSPLHIKTATMHGILISGRMVHYTPDTPPEKAQIISAGAYYRIDADTPHVSACVSDTECVTYLYQDGAFDFLPVQP